jgi:serine/threonine protein kinase
MSEYSSNASSSNVSDVLLSLMPIVNKNLANVVNGGNVEWSGSGSGAGNPVCVPTTIARQIKLLDCIGKGRYGEVYKAEWRAGYVAVKTFNSADEKSWDNECNIYNTFGFRHENILGFITADNVDRGTYTELWLITEFHENGSLFDYLTNNTITAQEALRMCQSIVNGLVHLHMPIEAVKGKPALAHCDLKSKNILVKRDLTCCISDFGLALSGDKNSLVIHSGGNLRTGTKRYMAPEILAKTIDMRSLISFQNAEMYSLALIIWELLRRCKFEHNGQTYSHDYSLPYQEQVGMDPTEEIMKQVVCEQKVRPQVNELWKEVPLLAEMAGLLDELWVDKPTQRLSALRVKKSLVKIKLN